MPVRAPRPTRLGEYFGVAHLSTGEIFRAQASQGTAFGLEAKRYMDGGELVPDEIVVGVIEECLAPGGPLGDGFVLDGFPRTLHQAQELDRVLDGRPLDLAINLDVPRDIVLDRLAGRRVCENCQRVYHVNLPPEPSTGPATRAAAGSCSATTTPRKRSTAGSQLYEEQTVPIIEYYRERGMLAAGRAVSATATTCSSASSKSSTPALASSPSG